MVLRLSLPGIRTALTKPPLEFEQVISFFLSPSFLIYKINTKNFTCFPGQLLRLNQMMMVIMMAY